MFHACRKLRTFQPRSIANGIMKKSMFHRLTRTKFANFDDFASSYSSYSSYYLYLLLTVPLLTIATSCKDTDVKSGVEYDTEQIITNWSATHHSKPNRIYEPKSAQEIQRLLQSVQSERTGEKIRPIGTALSPNGIGMPSPSSTSTTTTNNLLSVASLDHISINVTNRTVTVGAGVRVSEVLAALDKYNLTLQNFSSIQEQQLAGWTQVAAHGTGITLPTVDEMILSLQVATPAQGLLTLSSTLNPSLFQFMKVGLGSLGILTELTLSCIPKHRLREYMYTVTNFNSLTNLEHAQLLQSYRHVRYMWLPYTTTLVTVVSNPIDGIIDSTAAPTIDPAKEKILAYQQQQLQLAKGAPTASTVAVLATQPLIDLLISKQQSPPFTTSEALSLQNKSFSQLRDALLEIAPLDVSYIKQINQAEALYWASSTGIREANSTEILGFDCGGEQYVLEVCFPIGKVQEATGKDLTFVHKLLQLIEKYQIPAPSPIEQRWTASSSSPMSPAFSEDREQIFSWVGIIMYLPSSSSSSATGSSDSREAITKQFRRYVQVLQPLLEEYNAHAHWAKIELPNTADDLAARNEMITREDNSWLTWLGWKKALPLLQEEEQQKLVEEIQCRLRQRYPVEKFNAYRKALDPQNILGNELIDQLFAEKEEEKMKSIAVNRSRRG